MDLPFDGPHFPLREFSAALIKLAQDRHIYLGTSSWKYPGWCGQIYDRDRYVWRGKFSEKRFNDGCLKEYAEIFPTVCVDASYYKFPSPEYLERLAEQVPDGFRFSLKVTDQITALRFPKIARYGDRGGAANDHFLDAELFKAAFLRSIEILGEKAGALIFEFSRFSPSSFEGGGREFVERLGDFLSALPRGPHYAVEIRNPNLLRKEYLETLRSAGAAHVISSWSKMPSATEQLETSGDLVTDSGAVARLLLKPGRHYQEAVDRFSPYGELAEEQPEVRKAGASLIKKVSALRESGALDESSRSSYIYVNNRLEGNSPETIRGILHLAGLLHEKNP